MLLCNEGFAAVGLMKLHQLTPLTCFCPTDIHYIILFTSAKSAVSSVKRHRPVDFDLVSLCSSYTQHSLLITEQMCILQPHNCTNTMLITPLTQKESDVTISRYGKQSFRPLIGRTGFAKQVLNMNLSRHTDQINPFVSHWNWTNIYIETKSNGN